MADSLHTEDLSEYISIGKAARQIGMSVDTVRRWCDIGVLDFWLTPGGQRRVSVAGLERLREAS